MAERSVEKVGAALPGEPQGIEAEAEAWWRALEPAVGPVELFDVHTHIGRNDPDGFRQTPERLTAELEAAGARGVVFPMAEPDGYRAANDEVLAAAEASGGRLVAFCRVDPRDRAVEEARRCLAAGARGIKLHPRAEAFSLGLPAVRELIALAHEREAPVLIHAGRGIPALGEDALSLAAEFPRAKLILAHAAVSDLGWMWRVLPERPNVFVDTSWWNPADLLALFDLVPSGQILWASDSPYGLPLSSAAMHLRCAVQAGLGPEAIASIAGGQTARLLAGEEPLAFDPPRRFAATQDPLMERVAAHLYTAFGRAIDGGDVHESASLARLACDVGSKERGAVSGEVVRLLDLAEAAGTEPPPDRPLPPAVQFLMAALIVARTPDAPLPARPPADRRRRFP